MARPKKIKEPTNPAFPASGLGPGLTEDEMDTERKMLIGERLTLIRKDYERKTGKKWSQKILSQSVGLKEAAVQRMEDGKGGLIETYAVLFNFWLDKGYNLNWIIAKDNSTMSKYRVPENINAVNAELMVIEVEKLRTELVSFTTSLIEEAVDRALNNLLINQHLIGRGGKAGTE